METNQAPAISRDVVKITDKVMDRQFINVDRSQAEAIVKMVLECAEETARGERSPSRHYPATIIDARRDSCSDRAEIVVNTSGGEEILKTDKLSTGEGNAVYDFCMTHLGASVMLGIRMDEVLSYTGPRFLRVLATVEATE